MKYYNGTDLIKFQEARAQLNLPFYVTENEIRQFFFQMAD